ncbi:MAG: uL14 family ribosomal protein, partial [Sedimentisphaerales bacterium]|nr:uL14 family ribosomal protein [Sedimentisphaerales bacterium]
MIQQETIIDIADNSGAKTALCVRVLGGSTARGKYTRRTAGIGDVIVVAIKKSLPSLSLD